MSQQGSLHFRHLGHQLLVGLALLSALALGLMYWQQWLAWPEGAWWLVLPALMLLLGGLPWLVFETRLSSLSEQLMRLNLLFDNGLQQQSLTEVQSHLGQFAEVNYPSLK